MCLCLSPYEFWMPELIFKKLFMYIMEPQIISAAYFINSYLCVYMNPTVARQWLGKNISALKKLFVISHFICSLYQYIQQNV
jgi:hypothetical protein